MAGWFTLRRMLIGIFVFGAVAFGVEVYSVLIGSNDHVVIPGRAYRSAQPSPGDVQRYARTYGIRTIVNLRGCCDPFPWYLAEAEASADSDLTMEDITLSAGRLPAPCEIRRLMEVLDRVEKPILLHCRRGVDRTGLVSAIVRMMWNNEPLEQARNSLSLRYAHFSIGRTAAMQRFFDLYAKWLKQHGKSHSVDNFRHWAVNDYRPGVGSGTMKLVGNSELPSGQGRSLTLRATNTSCEPWRLKAGRGAGVHVSYTIVDEGNRPVMSGHAGLFDAEVPPTQSIDLQLAVPPIAKAGRYTLRADLFEMANFPFSQLGNDSFEQTLHVTEPQ